MIISLTPRAFLTENLYGSNLAQLQLSSLKGAGESERYKQLEKGFGKPEQHLIGKAQRPGKQHGCIQSQLFGKKGG